MVGTDLVDLVDLADPADLAPALGLEGMGHTDLALGLAGRRLEAVSAVHMDPVLALVVLVGHMATWA